MYTPYQKQANKASGITEGEYAFEEKGGAVIGEISATRTPSI
jgi:hypothetical protein